MLIGIDGNEANVESRVGVNEYAYQVLWNIYKLSDEWKGRHGFVIYLSNSPKDLPKEREGWEYKVIPGGGMWVIKKLMPGLWFSKKKPDVFFTPCHYVPPLLTIPRVCSIMDLGYLSNSAQFKRWDYWQLRLWSAWSITVSKQIIAISNTTKEDIVRHYRFARGKVQTTLLGYDSRSFNRDVSLKDVRRIKAKYAMGCDYVLFLGTLKPSKNIEGLIKAWAVIENRYEDTKLVIAGKKGWFFETIFELVQELGLGKRVLFTGFVDEKDKPALIAGAKLFVLPSYWEGFGIDVLSAMACGTPTLVSDRGSLPEVAGEAGIVVGTDPEEVAGGMEKVLRMKKMDYNRLVKKGLEQVKKFSWEEAARETLAILEIAARK